MSCLKAVGVVWLLLTGVSTNLLHKALAAAVMEVILLVAVRQWLVLCLAVLLHGTAMALQVSVFFSTPYTNKSAPAWKPSGGATPMQSGGRTPAWADGSRTGNPYDGSRTAYIPSGSRTPSTFGAGSATPAGGDAWSLGSKTPAYGWSAPTPAAQPAQQDAWGASAPTPRGYAGAPTPGAGLHSAPTPGAALGAPTPAAGGYGATPGAWAADTPAYEPPTPGASAATPGGWGAGAQEEEDGPRWGTPSP
jgi:transcription elongation factor SPT5